MATIETKAPGDTRSATVAEGKIMETENNYSHHSREELESALTRATERLETLEDENRILRFAQLSGGDSRLTDFWDKAHELANEVGFCTEYDKLAEALGGPARMLEWSGAVGVTVTLSFLVAVGGTATPNEVENHTMDYEADDYDIFEALKEHIENMSRWELDHDVDASSLEVTHTEPAGN